MSVPKLAEARHKLMETNNTHYDFESYLNRGQSCCALSKTVPQCVQQFSDCREALNLFGHNSERYNRCKLNP
jgi:hypothetical protein